VGIASQLIEFIEIETVENVFPLFGRYGALRVVELYAVESRNSFAPEAMIACVVAVVGSEDNDGVFALSAGFERVEDFAEIAVHFRAVCQVVA